MAQVEYPDMIQKLPDIDLDRPDVKGKLLQAAGKQVVFFTIDPPGRVPPHAHGAQWGIIIDGEVEITIGGVTGKYVKGDAYYIPAGVEHSAWTPVGLKAIEFFDEPDRYQPKPGA